ncbi:MAG: acetylglutamate kinase, partial [Proteobacteria bacterium]|nr:acetylglutamate kinase [Pseudomonadota bacterium]
MTKTVVIKYGGAAMTDPVAAEQLMREVVALSRDGMR